MGLVFGQKDYDFYEQRGNSIEKDINVVFWWNVPHLFYKILDKWVPEDATAGLIKRLIFERLIYTPLYNAFTIYMVSRLEGKDHKTALKQLEALYWPILSSSWKYLTIIQFLNLYYVPPVLRVLLLNIVGFFWTIYIANKRRQQQLKDKSSN